MSNAHSGRRTVCPWASTRAPQGGELFANMRNMLQGANLSSGVRFLSHTALHFTVLKHR